MSKDKSDNKSGFISRLLLKHFKSEASKKTKIEDESIHLPSSSEIINQASFENPDVTDPEIVQRAMTRLSEEGGIENDREEVDIKMKIENINDPVGVVEKFNNVLYQLRDSIIDEIRFRQVEEDRGIDTIGADNEDNKVTSMEYIIYEDEEGILIGGASNFIRNLCYKLDFSPIELELIKHAQNEAVRQTDVDELVAHTISNISTLWIPKKQP